MFEIYNHANTENNFHRFGVVLCKLFHNTTQNIYNFFVYFVPNDVNVSKSAYVRTRLQFMETEKSAEAM